MNECSQREVRRTARGRGGWFVAGWLAAGCGGGPARGAVDGAPPASRADEATTRTSGVATASGDDRADGGSSAGAGGVSGGARAGGAEARAGGAGARAGETVRAGTAGEAAGPGVGCAAGEATRRSLWFQVDDAFAPGARATISVDGRDVLELPLVRQGSPRTHVDFARATATVGLCGGSFVLGVRVAPPGARDERRIEVADGTFFVISSADGAVGVRQYPSRPLYR